MSVLELGGFFLLCEQWLATWIGQRFSRGEGSSEAAEANLEDDAETYQSSCC